ncbi:hypothetical protein [Streptomyces rishiriensis]|uniref:hypothetical protein n=1 Tax=Streptomyces rishiriensis TaxID=68264 RepID=UPI0027D7C56D|nr:hypothetical protein [Streptomyces rishiriensis]
MANSHARAAAEAAPGQLLRQAKRLLDQAQKLVDQAVIAERMKDTSWETIGEVLGGVTKSAAQKRFGPRVNDWGDNPRRLAALGNIGLPKRELDFGVAYAQLEDEWKAAGEIVAAQDLLAKLTNATTALSGANAHREGPNAEWHGDHIFVYANSDRSPAVPLPSWVLEATPHASAVGPCSTPLRWALHDQPNGMSVDVRFVTIEQRGENRGKGVGILGGQ